MTQALAEQFARRFIQRRDVKAVQFSWGTGGYMPDTQLRDPVTKQHSPGVHGPIGWNMDHLYAHLTGTATYGHYLLDATDQCRLFAFDIDLEKTGFWVPMPPFGSFETNEQYDAMTAPVACNPREEVWPNRAHPGRDWIKLQMGMLARKFVKVIMEETRLPCAAAYSGAKGIHVYGFTGPLPAQQVREAALFVLDVMNEWEPLRGQHFFTHKSDDPALGYRNFSIEVFPKQASLEGKDLGNLMRLPLGRNLKSSDPTFFLDLRTPPGVMAPYPDPVALLASGNPYL